MICFRQALSYRSFGAANENAAKRATHTDSTHGQHAHTHTYVHIRVYEHANFSLTHTHMAPEREQQEVPLFLLCTLALSHSLWLSLSVWETRILREQRAITTTCYSCHRVNSLRASSVYIKIRRTKRTMNWNSFVCALSFGLAEHLSQSDLRDGLLWCIWFDFP